MLVCVPLLRRGLMYGSTGRTSSGYCSVLSQGQGIIRTLVLRVLRMSILGEGAELEINSHCGSDSGGTKDGHSNFVIWR